MTKQIKQLIPLLTVMLILITVIFWYYDNEQPLTSSEVNGYMKEVSSQPHASLKWDLPALEKFLKNDDGRAFYTVNLYKFNKYAAYLNDDNQPPISGVVAFDKFGEVMIRLLLQHGSHPIFASNWIGENASSWERLVIVRYRSRRDIIDIFTSEAFAKASEHKLAALAKNERLVVQGLHLAELFGGLVLLLLIFAFLLVKKLAR